MKPIDKTSHLLDNTALWLDYLYDELNEEKEREIDKIILEDELLAILYEELILYILENGIKKNEMEQTLKDMINAKNRFYRKHIPSVEHLTEMIHTL